MYFTVRNIVIVCIGLMLVKAQNDGRYRPYGADGRYRPSNDGSYVHQNDVYIQTNEQFGGFDSRRFGGVVNIGGAKSTPKAAATTTTTSVPQTSSLPRIPPSPPFFVIDTRSNAVNNNNNINQNDVSAAKPNIKILSQEQEETADGYHYGYETENGILAEQSGQIVKAQTNDAEDILRTNGFYQYIGDDGKLYRVDYVANENGFVAQGDHLPTPPPIPPEIQVLLSSLASQ